jgi:hypothetical protein
MVWCCPVMVQRWAGAGLMVVQRWSSGLKIRNSISKNNLLTLKMEIIFRNLKKQSLKMRNSISKNNLRNLKMKIIFQNSTSFFG